MGHRRPRQPDVPPLWLDVPWAAIELGMAQENLGHRLTLLRGRANRSRSWVARELDVSVPTVARMECASFLPGAQLLARIARLFDVEVYELVADTVQWAP